MCTIHIIYIQSQCILAMWRCFVIMEEGGGGTGGAIYVMALDLFVRRGF